MPLSLDENVRRNIDAAINYCNLLEAFYGPGKEATDARRSLLHCLAQAMRADRLWAEDEMGLGGWMTAGFAFAMVPHLSRNYCTSECSFFVRSDGSTGHYSGSDCGAHTWTRPVGTPDPVTWSLHS
jgi:hypothetical protein